MKKMLVLALGVLLVASFCVPVVKAETKFQFTGNYRVRYQYDNNYLLYDDAKDESKSARWDHRFRWQPSFIVSDCLSLNTRIQAYNTAWGTNHGPGNHTTAADLSLNRVWMDIKTKYGMFRVGRMYGGSLGLDPLGYTGGMFIDQAHGVFTNVQPFESTSDRDRIVYNLPLGAFTFSAVYEKSNNGEVDMANTGGNNPSNPGYDEDADLYAAVGTYKWATGSANLSAVYSRIRSVNSDGLFGRDDTDMYTIAPALIQSFGPFTMHAELDYRWGTTRYDNNASADLDMMGWGAYVDGWYNYGPGQVGGLFQYVQGVNFDRGAGDTQEGIMGYGGDHYPFVMMQSIIGLNEFTDSNPANLTGGDQNYWAVGVVVNHNLTDVLMLHAALGYFSLVNTPNAFKDLDKDLGVEADLGLNWKIMEGLDFTSMVGYWWTGGAFEANGQATGLDVGNAYTWKNMLWMSF